MANVPSGDALECSEHFEKRSLKKGSVGWILLVGLGVSYTISGDFSGRNYGMANGGWLGLFIAFAVMGIMHACTVFGLAELSSAIPTAGAGYGFARSAMGRTGGFATGLALAGKRKTPASALIASAAIDIVYFRVYARNHLVGNAPEEEFARLNAAEAELLA